MTQHDLDRILARVTGESARRIRHMGFSLVIIPTLPRKSSAKKGRPASVMTTRSNRSA